MNCCHVGTVAAALLLLLTTSLRSQTSYPLEIQLSGPAGAYELKRWQRDWPGCKFQDGISEGRVSIVEADKLKWMRVICRANQIGPDKGGIGWRKPIPPRNRVELAYRVRLSKDFEFVKGGKLPGLCGGPESVTGGNPANGKNGFSARFMWRADGRGEVYAYHLDQPNKYGESFAFENDARLPIDQPFNLIMRIAMNEIGENDGTLEAWLQLGEKDAIKVVNRTDLRWRTDESVEIDSLLVEVFHGGNDTSWAPKKDCHVDLTNFRLFE